MSLKNKKNVVITGASGQVGSELVKILKSKFNIIPIVRSVNSDVSNLNYFCCKDLADKNESIRTFNKIIHKVHSIDCLINVAGGFDMGNPVEQQDWSEMFKINFSTMLNATSCVLKHMKLCVILSRPTMCMLSVSDNNPPTEIHELRFSCFVLMFYEVLPVTL